MRLKKQLIAFLFCLLVSNVFAEYNSFGIPDSAEIRKQVPREWFEGSLEMLRTLGSRLYVNSVGVQFQLSFEEQDEHILIIVAPQSQTNITSFKSEQMSSSVEKVFRLDSPGSWLLVRDKKSGEPIVVRYYFARDNGVYIQFRPNFEGKQTLFASPGKANTLVDMVIFDSYAARAVPLGVSFETFYTASFADAYELTKHTIPWKYVNPAAFPESTTSFPLHRNSSHNAGRMTLKNTGQTYFGVYDEMLVMIQTIRANLPNTVYVDDAIYDEYGEPVSLIRGNARPVAPEHIGKLSLSSHGYVKWIVDGIVEPLTGSYLRRAPLVGETTTLKETSYQGIVANEYSINSALDWTRNLAAAVLSATTGRTILYENSGVDVTIEPFAAMLTDKGIVNMAGYINNSGYKIEYLKQILYVLSATNPEYFYLAAIRQSDKDAKIETRVFNDCAAIFPYFDKSGAFRVVVFCDGVEYDFDEFRKACTASGSDVFVHLTRVQTTARYYPQTRARRRQQ